MPNANLLDLLAKIGQGETQSNLLPLGVSRPDLNSPEMVAAMAKLFPPGPPPGPTPGPPSGVELGPPTQNAERNRMAQQMGLVNNSRAIPPQYANATEFVDALLAREAELRMRRETAPSPRNGTLPVEWGSRDDMTQYLSGQDLGPVLPGSGR